MTDINLPNKNVVRSDLMKISFFKFNEETCSRQQLLTNDKNRSYVEGLITRLMSIGHFLVLLVNTL